MLRMAMLLAGLIVLAGGVCAHAASGGVELTLTGGEVVGSVRGQGTATVTVAVRNATASPLLGVAIRVYYSTFNAAPGDYATADWRVHEFLFEPPLEPDQSREVSFTDDDAAEYILLEVSKVVTNDQPPPATTARRPEAGLPPADGNSLLYDGSRVSLSQGLKERGGTVYVASRDLLDAVGGGLSYDAQTYQIVLARRGHELKVREDKSGAEADGAKIELKHKVLSIDGTSFLPLLDVAPYLGLTATFDKESGYYELLDE